ncbi:MAG: VWA domain-containing protein [Terracidiphilus sp.]
MQNRFVLLALLSLFILPLHAQSNSRDAPQNVPVLKTTTRAVVVDIVVTDKGGSSVGGLQQRDFSVLEGGKAQAIDFFEEHKATSAAPAAMPQLPPNVYSNEPAVAPNEAVNVLLLDSLNTEEADQTYAHKQIEGFIGNLQPGMRVAVYTLNARLRLLQGFTSDGALLRAAIESKAAAPGTTIVSRSRQDDLFDKEAVTMAGDPQSAMAVGRSQREYAGTQQSQTASLTLATLQQLARALSAIPGRKNLIWIASTFPVALFPEGDNRALLTAFHGHELPAALRETVNMLTRARVALYPVSARGLLDDRTMNADSSGQPNGDNFETNPYKESPAIRATTATMDQLAIDTGGQAVYTTNNVAADLTRDIQDGAHYYSISYTPSNEKTDGAFRRIEVKLTEGKYKLAYRRGYYADTGSTQAAQQPPDPLAPLLSPGMPAATQIIYRMRVIPEGPPAAGAARAGGNAKLAAPLTRFKMMFQIPADSISFAKSDSGTNDARIRVAMVAYGHDGKPVNWTGGLMMLKLSEAQYAKAQQTGIAAPMEIDLPNAEVSLATGIFDVNTEKAGTLQIAMNPASVGSATSPWR